MLREIAFPENMPVALDLFKVECVPYHVHEDLQMIYVLRGTVRLKHSYTAYLLNEGDVHFIHSMDVHGIERVSDDNLVLVLSLKLSFFLKIFPDLTYSVFTTKVNQEDFSYQYKRELVKFIFFLVKEMLEEHGESAVRRIREISENLINLLYLHFQDFSVNREDKFFDHQLHRDQVQVNRIARVISEIYKNYRYKISLKSLAEKEHLNRDYLSHLFQKYIGESFRDFVGMVRIEMSEYPLLSTNVAISQLAMDCGFSNMRYYIESFKVWFGMHPKEYRERCRKETVLEKEISIERLPLSLLQQHLADQPGAFFHSIEQWKTERINLHRLMNYEELSALLKLPALVFRKEEGSASLQMAGDVSRMLMDFYRKSLESAVDFTIRHEHMAGLSGSIGESGHFPEYNLEEHKIALKFLDRMINGSGCEELLFQDSDMSQNGLISVNGMKKPLYYLFEFIMKLYERCRKIGRNLLITANHEDYIIFLYNLDTKTNLHYEFQLKQTSFAYSITKEILRSSNSSNFYWSQLNYKKPLSCGEIAQIESMTHPEIQFDYIPEGIEASILVTLEPLDAMLLHIRRA